jgi:hypothetical protein
MRRRMVIVSDRMQHGYTYELTEPEGSNFDPDFRPGLTPPELLALGVFGGKYMTDCHDEFPSSWFRHARLSPTHHDPTMNFFGVNASLPLSVLAQERLDLSRRSARLVPVVLPLPSGPPLPG